MAPFPSARMSVRIVLAGFALFLPAGCQNAKYTGAEPSARSFYEDPDFHQTYIGFDLNFTLEDSPPRKRPAVRIELIP